MRQGYREVEGEMRTGGRPSPPSGGAAPSEELRVLLVDRHPRTLRFMTMVFTSSGCRATAASTAEEAVGFLAGAAFDLVVADSGLPDLGAAELLRIVRERYPLTRVIVTTEGAADAGAGGALEQAYGQLRKPFALEEVQRLVERLRNDRPARAPRPGEATPDARRAPRSQTGLAALRGITALALHGGDPAAYVDQALARVVEGLGIRTAALVLRGDDGHLTVTPRGDQTLASRVLADLSPRLEELLGAGGAGSARLTDAQGGWTALIAPIPGAEAARGLLAVATVTDEARALDDADALLPCFAGAIALSIQALLVEDELESHVVNTISSLIIALESRDAQLKSHAARVSLYAGEVAKHMGLPAAHVAVIRRAGMLHDLGALSLLQPGAPDAVTGETLAPEAQHALAGAKILKPLRFLAPEALAVRHQHERYDGKGQPDGLIGEAIPVAARIVAVADAFDALTSQPPSGSALDIQTALRQLARYAGARFDPGVMEALARIPTARLAEIRHFYDASGDGRPDAAPGRVPPAPFVGASKRLAGRNGSQPGDTTPGEG